MDRLAQMKIRLELVKEGMDPRITLRSAPGSVQRLQQESLPSDQLRRQNRGLCSNQLRERC